MYKQNKKRHLRYHVMLSIFLSTGLDHNLNATHAINNSDLSLVTQSGTIKDEIYQLLELSQINCNKSLNEVVNATQKTQGAGGWLRKPGAERWDVEELCNDVSKSNTYMALFEALDMTKEIEPSKNHYTYVFLLGATIRPVRSRLAHLIKLWNSGVRFDNIVVLGSDRDLDQKIENETVLYHSDILPIKSDWKRPETPPTTEYEMMKMVFDQVTLPSELDKVALLWVNTPKIKTAAGIFRNPNTSDTIKSWLATSPQKGSVLSISNQPYVGYQHACLKTYIPQEFTVETIGYAASEKEKIAILFDTLARWLYQEREYQKRQ